MATEDNWEEILRSNYTELLKYIDTENGLFGELRKVRIFTPIALKSFRDCKDSTEKIDRILRNLQKKDFESFKKFCEALKDCAQEHIVQNYLSKVQDVSSRQYTTTDSPLNADLPHNRAITHGMSECFKLYWNDLIASITFDDGLLTAIDSRKIFTVLQLNKLRDIDLEMRRTEQMLCWLERGSEKQFLDFCDALQACNQSFIVSEYLSPKIQERKITENNIAQPDPLVNQKIPVKPHDVRGDPEGAVVVPLPLEVTVGGIRFVPCNQEFLKTFQGKVLKKVAYRCQSNPRGRALIMNNRFFSVKNLGTRLGSDVDTDNLKALFISLRFDTVVYSDNDAEEMWDILVKESREGHHKGYDMFVLFLMSHGIQGEIYGMDGKSLKTAAIANLFNGKNCPSLLEKPKLFFIQACQGDIKTAGVMTTDTGMTATDSGMTVCDSPMPVQHKNATMEEMMRKLNLAEDFQMSIPLPPESKFASDAVADDKVHEMADMAMIYATVDGYVAWRRVDTGSLFVQCLINVLTEHAHEKDLMTMITKVSSSLHELEMVENQGRFKQISEKRDSLRREVYLLPL